MFMQKLRIMIFPQRYAVIYKKMFICTEQQPLIVKECLDFALMHKYEVRMRIVIYFDQYYHYSVINH